MTKVAVDLDLEQIESALRRLEEKDRWRLTKQLVAEEMDQVVKKLRRNVRRQRLSSQEINRIVEEARQEYYDRSRR